MKVSLASERLEVTLPPEAEGRFPQRHWVPLNDIEHVVIDHGVHVTNYAMEALLRRGVPILFVAHGKMPSGLATPINTSTVFLARQLDSSRDEALRLEQSKRLVYAKISNQKRILQRLASNRKEPPVATSWLGSMANQCLAAASLDALRGLEGAASGRYFETLASYFPQEFPFERRTRRPPHNPVNAVLSFVYTLLASELCLHLRAHAIEPGWGFFHEPENNRPCLALDLIEPFRAPIADALAIDLFNHKRFEPADFTYPESGGCLLERSSRRKVFAALEARMEREFLHEQSGHRTTLRQQFIDTCLAAKKTFNDRTPFDPFLMN